MRRVKARYKVDDRLVKLFDPHEMPYLSISSLELKAAAFSELATSLPFGTDQANAVEHMTSLRTFAAMRRFFLVSAMIDLVVRGR